MCKQSCPPDCVEKFMSFPHRSHGEKVTVTTMVWKSSALGWCRRSRHFPSQLLQDYFAANGFTVLGADYFFGETIENQSDRSAWIAKARPRAAEAVPKWLEALKEKYGTTGTKYTAVGYCFGGVFSIDAASMDFIAAAALAHPAYISDAQFENVKKPLLLCCAEVDHTFGLESRRRAEDILVAKKALYHFQVFSQVQHGFASRGDPNDPNIRWCKEECARGVVSWFQRFCE